jgi:hypothetical protein
MMLKEALMTRHAWQSKATLHLKMSIARFEIFNFKQLIQNFET